MARTRSILTQTCSRYKLPYVKDLTGATSCAAGGASQGDIFAAGASITSGRFAGTTPGGWPGKSPVREETEMYQAAETMSATLAAPLDETGLKPVMTNIRHHIGRHRSTSIRMSIQGGQIRHGVEFAD